MKLKTNYKNIIIDFSSCNYFLYMNKNNNRSITYVLFVISYYLLVPTLEIFLFVSNVAEFKLLNSDKVCSYKLSIVF